jgi:hypothetical protein
LPDREAGTVDDRRERGAESASRRVPDRRAEARAMRDRQHAEFGGLHWGTAFFGWLVAVGLAALLLAIVSAAGAAVGLTSADTSDASTIGIVGGVLLLAVLMVAYYAGGYVAGRMARFDGPRQGIGVWLLGLLVTLVLAAAGALLGAEYNVLERLQLPRIPIDEGSLTTGGVIVLVAVVVGTLLAAIAGGKAGTHFHRKVDRAGVA